MGSTQSQPEHLNGITAGGPPVQHRDDDDGPLHLPSQHALKVVIVGDAGTGKTCLMHRYILDAFTRSISPTLSFGTAGKKHVLKCSEQPDILVDLHIWYDWNYQSCDAVCFHINKLTYTRISSFIIDGLCRDTRGQERFADALPVMLYRNAHVCVYDDDLRSDSVDHVI